MFQKEPMPRKLRVEYPGAVYHVMSRGDRREKIFLNDVDRHDFVRTLAEACQKTNWQVHAYCLMGNHYHLVLAGRCGAASEGDDAADQKDCRPDLFGDIQKRECANSLRNGPRSGRPFTARAV
jgi:hypothetical protein